MYGKILTVILIFALKKIKVLVPKDEMYLMSM